MPRNFIPHCDDVSAYTFPLVCSIIEELKVPKALADIPEPYQGELVATLAIELANISSVVLQLGKRMHYTHRMEETLLSRHGGVPYLAALRASRAQHKKFKEAWDDRRQWERQASFLCDRWVPPPSDAKHENSDDGHHWRYDILPAERIDFVREKLKAAMAQDRESRAVSDRLHHEFIQLTNAIKSTDAYKKDAEEMRWRQVKAVFSISPEYQASGAALFLRNVDYDWWVSFTTTFSKAVETDGNSAPYKMALRDPEVLEAIQHLADGTPKWYAFASEFLKTHSQEWGTIDPKPGALKEARNQMLIQDQKSLEWLKARRRTANFYSLWLRRIANAHKRNSGSGYWAPAKLDLDWLQRQLSAFCAGPAFDNEDWRLNELSWCLSRAQPRIYRFEPLLSQHHGLEDWEKHQNLWWARIEAAQLGQIESQPEVRKS